MQKAILGKNKKRVAVIFTVLLLFSVGGVFVWVKHKNPQTDSKSYIGKDGVNYGPPTATDKKETEEHKQDIGSKQPIQNEPSQDSNPANQANVTITYLKYTNNAVTAGGIVSNVFEDGGQCTLTLTKNGQTVSSSSTGSTDVNKTTCPQITISKDKLSSGSWSAILSYSMNNTKGASQAQNINVP